jgi:hypothetical protein
MENCGVDRFSGKILEKETISEKKNVSFIEFQNRIKVNYLTKALKLVFIGFSSKNTDLTKITYLLKKTVTQYF